MVDRNASVPTGNVLWSWAGNLTPTSFSLKADVANSVGTYRLVVSPNADLSGPVFTSNPVAPAFSQGLSGCYFTVSFDVTGLTPSTKYYYQVQAIGAPSNIGGGSLTTAPVGAAAFTFLTGSCSKLNPAAAPSLSLWYSVIHRSMARESALFFLHIDDILYSDAPAVNPAYQRDTNMRLYSRSPDVAALSTIMPLAWIWGDHEAFNDSTLDTANGETIFRNVRTVYRETMPHYPFIQQTLGETNIDHVISSQQFDIGKCRFYLADCMSQSRTGGSALGQGIGNGDYWDQRSYLAGALSQATADGVTWFFLVLPRGWMGYNQGDFNDDFSGERTAICDLIEAANVPVCLITGDTHAVGFDDGASAGSFATDGFCQFPFILASAMFNTCVPASPGNTLWNWNGSNHFFTFSGSTPKDGYFVTVTLSADNTTWTAVAKGTPFDQVTFAPTVIATVSSNDVTPAVSFANAAPSVAHGSPLTVNLDKTWFGACSVHWASSDGQSGNVSFLPNKTRASFSITFAAAGSPTITLSSPSGCTISGTNPATVTVS